MSARALAPLRRRDPKRYRWRHKERTWFRRRRREAYVDFVWLQFGVLSPEEVQRLRFARCTNLNCTVCHIVIKERGAVAYMDGL